MDLETRAVDHQVDRLVARGFWDAQLLAEGLRASGKRSKVGDRDAQLEKQGNLRLGYFMADTTSAANMARIRHLARAMQQRQAKTSNLVFVAGLGSTNAMTMQDQETTASKPIVCRRTVKLSRRRRLPGGGRFQRCERDEHEATLAISAGNVGVRRPNSVEKDLPAKLELSVVHVGEVDPPVGVEAGEWHLLTTEPIGTDADILRVVDS